MALLFSKVSLFNGESEAEFLTMGIPRDYEDLEGYTAFAEYVGELSDECDILLLGLTPESVTDDLMHVISPEQTMRDQVLP